MLQHQQMLSMFNQAMTPLNNIEDNHYPEAATGDSSDRSKDVPKKTKRSKFSWDMFLAFNFLEMADLAVQVIQFRSF